MLTPVLSAHWDEADSFTLDGYTRHRGYEALPKALAMEPDALIQLVKDSGLRGRGGAGFPTGMKWGFIPQGPRARAPSRTTSWSTPTSPSRAPARTSRSCWPTRTRWSRASSSRRTRSGPRTPSSTSAARSCTSSAGCRRPSPRPTPPATSARTSTARASTSSWSSTPAPAPTSAARRRRCSTRSRATAASRGCARRSRRRTASTPARPSSTTSSRSPRVPSIVLGGAEWFSAHGHREEQGLHALLAVRHVKRPGQYEAPLGITLRQLLDLPAACARATTLKFWTPGGSSHPAAHRRAPRRARWTTRASPAAGSMLGTKALQCFDETTCVVRCVLRWTEFYAHESCGKCTPCREGTYWMVQILQRLEAGHGHRGGHRHAARHLRQHLRPLVLRARRRRHQPDRHGRAALPRGVRAAPHAAGLPVRPGGLHRLRRRHSRQRPSQHRTLGILSRDWDEADAFTIDGYTRHARLRGAARRRWPWTPTR